MLRQSPFIQLLREFLRVYWSRGVVDESVHLFRERSVKGERDNPERYCRYLYFPALFLDFSMTGKSDKMARDAMCVGLVPFLSDFPEMLTTSRNLKILTITFGVVALTFLCTTFSRNSCRP